MPGRNWIRGTLFLLVFVSWESFGEAIPNLEGRHSDRGEPSPDRRSFLFDGYTNHWHREEWDWVTSHGLFHVAQPSARSEVWAMEEEIGNQLRLEELWIEPGFVKELALRNVSRLDSPSIEQFAEAVTKGHVLVSLTDRSPLSEELLEKIPEEYRFRRNRAFVLRSDPHFAFVICCHSKDESDRLKKHIDEAVDIVANYDLHRGIAGVQTNFLHITTAMRHNPFDLIDLCLGLGCDWLMVAGFNDWMIPGPVNEALQEIDFPFTLISGQYVTGGFLYGMETYPDIQDNTIEECLDWADENDGCYFSSLSQSDHEQAERFDGYTLGSPSDWSRFEELDAPFLTNAGSIGSDIPPTTVAFLEKGTELSRGNLMHAILSKRAVAIFEKGTVAGPPSLRDGLRILLLDRTWLEKSLGREVAIRSEVIGATLKVSLQNRTPEPIEGELGFNLPSSLSLDAPSPTRIEVEPRASVVYEFPILFTPESTGRDNPIGVHLTASGIDEWSLTHVDLPSAVEMHSLIVDTSGTLEFPVTLYNYTHEDRVFVELEIEGKKGAGSFKSRVTRTMSVPSGESNQVNFNLSLDQGEYSIAVTALGVTKRGKIVVASSTETATAREEDLDGDGIPEIVMENGTTRATVLLFGGRVIEYIVKSKNENLMFKLWPEEPPLAGEIGGTRSFYPYGGLEEFTGYPYIGGHIVFDHEILEASGSKASVRVWANIHGNRISKTYTLFADSPLLEARYEMEAMTPTLNVIGINPLFEIGPSTGPEDRYYFPEEELLETIPELERYYGRGVFPTEGWAAGYDTEMDISLLIGYPVNDAIYLHLWNNHPDNTPTPYYYTELQPWLELSHGTTTYFTYYVYGKEGPWKTLVEDFKNLGLITHRESPQPWNLQ